MGQKSYHHLLTDIVSQMRRLENWSYKQRRRGMVVFPLIDKMLTTTRLPNFQTSLPLPAFFLDASVAWYK